MHTPLRSLFVVSKQALMPVVVPLLYAIHETHYSSVEICAMYCAHLFADSDDRIMLKVAGVSFCACLIIHRKVAIRKHFPLKNSLSVLPRRAF